MSLQAVQSRLFVEVILTFALVLLRGKRRNDDYRSSAVKPQDVTLREPKWPARTTQIAHLFSNHLELPSSVLRADHSQYVSRHAGMLRCPCPDFRYLTPAASLYTRD
jgi:hypothetical protein